MYIFTKYVNMQHKYILVSYETEFKGNSVIGSNFSVIAFKYFNLLFYYYTKLNGAGKHL